MSKTSRRLAQLNPSALSGQLTEGDAKSFAANSNEVVHASTAKGLIYSLSLTLGAMLGEPDLPEHMRSGYRRLMEMVRNVESRVESIG